MVEVCLEFIGGWIGHDCRWLGGYLFMGEVESDERSGLLYAVCNGVRSEWAREFGCGLRQGELGCNEGG